jgi:hypothetical protein
VVPELLTTRREYMLPGTNTGTLVIVCGGEGAEGAGLRGGAGEVGGAVVEERDGGL